MAYRLFILILLFMTMSCSKHKLIMPPDYDVSYEKTMKAINSLYISMTVEEMNEFMIPVLPGYPHYKELKNGKLEYYFAVGVDSQFRVEMRFDKNVKNKSLSFPNGIVTKIGKFEKRTKWNRKYKDSFEIE